VLGFSGASEFWRASVGANEQCIYDSARLNYFFWRRCVWGAVGGQVHHFWFVGAGSSAAERRRRNITLKRADPHIAIVVRDNGNA